MARSTFKSKESKECQNSSAPEHFWKLRCRKSAGRCGAKHIWQSKVSKHVRFGALLEVVEKVRAVVARSTFGSKKCQNLSRPEDFWKLRCWKSARRCGAKHIYQVNMYKTPQSRTAFGSCDEANFPVKMYKTPGFGPLVDDSMAIRYRKRTQLWRDARLEVKSVKNCGLWANFWGVSQLS